MGNVPCCEATESGEHTHQVKPQKVTSQKRDLLDTSDMGGHMHEESYNEDLDDKSGAARDALERERQPSELEFLDAADKERYADRKSHEQKTRLSEQKRAGQMARDSVRLEDYEREKNEKSTKKSYLEIEQAKKKQEAEDRLSAKNSGLAFQEKFGDMINKKIKLEMSNMEDDKDLEGLLDGHKKEFLRKMQMNDMFHYYKVEEERAQKEREEKLLAEAQDGHEKKEEQEQEKEQVTPVPDDAFTKFDASLPFAKTDIKKFFEYLHKALIVDKTSNQLTVKDFKEAFDAPEWQAAFADKNGVLNKVLQHSVFKDPDMKEDEIRPTFLSEFALLTCTGSPEDKAISLYHLLQDGGLRKHNNISANDKDFKPIFSRLCALATYQLFEIMESSSEFKSNYSADEITSVKEAHEAVLEDKFLDEVYDRDSKLYNESWLKKVAKADWVFSSRRLREAVFVAAEVELKQH